MTRSDKILIIGDFNIHLNKPSDPLGKAFLRLWCFQLDSACPWTYSFQWFQFPWTRCVNPKCCFRLLCCVRPISKYICSIISLSLYQWHKCFYFSSYQPGIHTTKLCTKLYALSWFLFVFVLVSGFWFFVFDLLSCSSVPCPVSCFVFPCPHVSFKFPCLFPWLNFHALLCLLSFNCLLVLPSGSLCLSALFPPGLLLCAPPLRYHTWLPSSSLSSPVPRLVISVCVLSLCVSLHSSSGHCLYSVFGCPCSCLVCFGFEISMFVLYFAFFFALCWTDLFCYFVLLLRCYFGFCPWFIFPCSLGFFLPSALN